MSRFHGQTVGARGPCERNLLSVGHLCGTHRRAMRPRPRSLRKVAAALVILLCACGDNDGGDNQPLLAVLSAFPAELAPFLEEAAVAETIVVDGRTFRLGTLGRTPVVLGLTGIGLVNAAEAAEALLDWFAPAGVVVSGVGGSPLRIGDVVVPVSWTLRDGGTYVVHPPWNELVRVIADSGAVSLDRCTLRQATPSGELALCLPHDPVVAVGGLGRSSDPFGGAPVRCVPGGGDVFGCDVNDAFFLSASTRKALERAATAKPEAPVLEDMETAAIARVAAARGVPFIAFRGVSDGAGDPLGLPGFPAQFFTYYRLAARNAASVTLAFIDLLSGQRQSAGRRAQLPMRPGSCPFP